jgi:anaerobic ribonucleoside-triphosphate reductase
MNFGHALEELKKGNKVARQGWNGKGMFIYLVEGQTVNIEKLRNEASKHFEVEKDLNRGKRVKINSHIDMKAADGSIVVGWLASQTDMLADDWEVVL